MKDPKSPQSEEQKEANLVQKERLEKEKEIIEEESIIDLPTDLSRNLTRDELFRQEKLP